jgi:hypothetical protein
VTEADEEWPFVIHEGTTGLLDGVGSVVVVVVVEAGAIILRAAVTGLLVTCRDDCLLGLKLTPNWEWDEDEEGDEGAIIAGIDGLFVTNV